MFTCGPSFWHGNGGGGPVSGGGAGSGNGAAGNDPGAPGAGNSGFIGTRYRANLAGSPWYGGMEAAGAYEAANEIAWSAYGGHIELIGGSCHGSGGTVDEPSFALCEFNFFNELGVLAYANQERNILIERVTPAQADATTAAAAAAAGGVAAGNAAAGGGEWAGVAWSDNNIKPAGGKVAYTHYRVNVSQVWDAGAFTILSRVKFFAPDGTEIDVAAADGSVATASASDFYAPANYTPQKPFYGGGSFWASMAKRPVWLQLAFNVARKVAKIELTGYSQGTNPRIFTIEASNDGVTWKTIKSVNSVSWTGDGSVYPILV